jgi:CubicO group peptidase (beta-lactamase class C family)
MTELPLAETTARRLLADAARTQTTGRVPSLVTGVVRDGSLAWSAGRGQVDGEVPDADVQYRIGSITKPITAVAVLRLRDEGKLDLDDPVERHVPGTPFGERTVGQLLAHNSGLRAEAPGEWWERVPGTSWAELAAQFSTASELPHGAGRRYHYSNLGFAVLGEIVARRRGKPWAEVIQDEVLLPLGMTRTTTRPTGRAAKGWAVHPWADVLLPEPEHDAGAMAAAGQLWATLTDLGRFAAFLLGDTGDVLAPSTLEEMREPAGVDISADDWKAYGLGLSLQQIAGVTYIGHGGSMPGFVAGIMVDPEQQTGAVVLSNATSGLDGGLLTRALTTVRELEPRIVDAWVPLQPEQLQNPVQAEGLRMVGTWYWGTNAYGIRLKAGGELDLLGLLHGGRPSRFRPDDSGTWVGRTGYFAGEPLRPVLDGEGRLISLNLGSFALTRTAYDPAAPVPGGVHPDGWQPGGLPLG